MFISQKTRKAWLGFLFASLFQLASNAQVNLPYYNDFKLATSLDDWTFYQLKAEPSFGMWKNGSRGFDDNSSLCHQVNHNTDTIENWCVTPALNFTAASTIAFKLLVYNGEGRPFTNSDVGVWYSKASNNPAQNEFVEIGNITNQANGTFNWRDTSLSIPFNAGTGYIGFKFKSAGEYITVDIDNLSINSKTTGLKESMHKSKFFVYPNPSSGYFFIESNQPFNGIEISNLMGETVYTKQMSVAASSDKIDISFLTKGIYLLRLSNGVNTAIQKLHVN